MSANARDRHKHPVTDEQRIEGPIPEYNRFDEYTGHDYFRCRRCGAEALRRIDLEGCCA